MCGSLADTHDCAFFRSRFIAINVQKSGILDNEKYQGRMAEPWRSKIIGPSRDPGLCCAAKKSRLRGLRPRKADAPGRKYACLADGDRGFGSV
jgi:hypothetical protein